MGSLHEMTASWSLPLLMTTSICVVWALLALYAGRPQIIIRTQTGNDIIIDNTHPRHQS
ncbi:hypothetical protein [Photobacterium piscicola]|uniref:hypothetical protein n=1 Tax=Photobacterium piscicola TaxID=1378299 RepID=UPI002E19AB3A|nr:hypothetical protein [Photobacterium piscicola]